MPKLGIWEFVGSLVLLCAICCSEALGNQNEALIMASKNNDLKHVQALLEKGADANALSRRDSHSALTAASENGHVEIVRVLLEHGADMNEQNARGKRPLQCAARKGHIDVAKLLLEKGADINADTGGFAPLVEAAWAGNI